VYIYHNYCHYERINCYLHDYIMTRKID